MQKNWILIIMLALVSNVVMLVFPYNISLYIDNQRVPFEIAPKLQGDITFVPVCILSEQLGVKVDFYDDGTIWISNYDDKESTLMLTVGEKKATFFYPYHLEGNVNDPEIQKFLALSENNDLVDEIKRWGTSEFGGDFIECDEFTMPSAPYIKDDSIMVPLRFVAEHLNFNVKYEKGRIDIYNITPILLDGQKISSLQVGDNINKFDQKNVLNLSVALIKQSRGEAISSLQEISNLSCKGYLYSFFDDTGNIVAAWQFYVPKIENEKTSGWDSMYLYDSLNQKWYNADAVIYEDYLYGEHNLEAYLSVH